MIDTIPAGARRWRHAGSEVQAPGAEARDLVRHFFGLGVAVAVAIAVAAAWFAEARLTELVLAETAARAADPAGLELRGRVSASDFTAPHSADERRALAARLEPVLDRADPGHRPARVALIAGDGLVVYSDDPSEVGRVRPWSGLAISTTWDGAMVQVRTPILIDGRVVGLYELHLDDGPVRAVRSLVWGTVLAGLGLLLVAALIVVRCAAARARQHQEERAQMARQLAAAEEQALRQAGRERDELLDTIAHEIRRPLTLVHGYAELLHTGVLPPEDHPEVVEVIFKCSRDVDRLLGDLTDAARTSDGHLRLRPAEADLTDVVARAAAQFRQQPGGDRIVLDLPGAPLPAWVDADRIDQIVGNLLTNALRYAPTGRIRVRLANQAERLLLEVEDRGPGMPREVLARVWERFYRAPDAQRAGLPGSGIGLAVVKSLAEAHGGGVEVVSAVGLGTTFRVWLPPGGLARPAAGIQEVA